MFKRLTVLLAATLAALALAGLAQARGGNYVFDGGTSAEQAQVRSALNVSSFNWSTVPQQITIHVASGIDSEASPGELWLDANLLDSGSFAWGVVQHEYAHQVDFFVLKDSQRGSLTKRLGGTSWWEVQGGPVIAHGDQTGERFASSLAWAYWPSKLNSMAPQPHDHETSSITPKKLRALLGTVIAAG
jgi:hypothetical protein